MKQVNLPQLNEALMVLHNINDNIRRLEEEVFEIGIKLKQIEQKLSNEHKCTIVLEKSPKTFKGESKNGKIV